MTLRTPYRTYRLTWAEVRHADIVPTNPNHLVAIVRVTTSDGRSIKVDGVGTRWRRRGLEVTPVGHTVQLINTYADAAR